jgi:hypothetical protein
LVAVNKLSASIIEGSGELWLILECLLDKPLILSMDPKKSIDINLRLQLISVDCNLRNGC